MSKRGFPGIAKAALEISYDNGGIHRGRTEARMFRALNRLLARATIPNELLAEIDAWLAALPEDELTTVCCGEVTEQEEILKSAPMFTDQLLNDIFERAA